MKAEWRASTVKIEPLEDNKVSWPSSERTECDARSEEEVLVLDRASSAKVGRSSNSLEHLGEGEEPRNVLIREVVLAGLDCERGEG